MQRWDSPVPAMGSLPMVGEMNPDRDYHTGGFGDQTRIKRTVAEVEVDGDGTQVVGIRGCV